MSDVFELRSADAAGRIGELRVPRSDTVVETPALMPVVNPNLRTISPARLETEFGAEICITNGYIISRSDYPEARSMENYKPPIQIQVRPPIT